MDLSEITANIGTYTTDCILVTKAHQDDPARHQIVWCNAAFTALTGYELDEIRGAMPGLLHGPDTAPERIEDLCAATAAGTPATVVLTLYTKARDPYLCEVTLTPLPDPSGRPLHWISHHRDITEQTEREQGLEARNRALEASERALQEEKIQLAGIAAVAQHAQELITITDTEFRILWANEAFIRKSGYPAAAVRGSNHCDLLDKRSDFYSSRDAARKAILNDSFEAAEVRNVDRAGTLYWTDMRVSVQRDAHGRVERFVIVERDVTERRRQRLDLERSRVEIALAAIRDPLTSLPNRRGLEEGFARMAERAERLGHGLGLLQIDLDFFKQINDTLGHAAGDAVLREVTDRLQAQLGPEGFAARIGGDEFVVAIEVHHAHQDLQRLSERLLQEIGRPVEFEGAECRFGVSIGHSQKEDPPFSLDAMMIQADIALYRAKRNGRNAAHGFTAELARETRAKKTLADQLNVAIDNGDFYALYQPQIDALSGAVVGVEALARWDRPDHGRVAPGSFLPLARELNLESVIDRQMLEVALADLAQVRGAGADLPRVSVNVSARRLRSPSLIDELSDLAMPEGALAFELLESTFLDDTDARVLWTLDALRERRIQIEIDDFGTGHASITGLLRVKPDRLKTDRTLLAPAVEDYRMRKLFALIVEIGQTLDIAVTAEGVESEAHASIARQLGCSVLQGYHFARPMPVDALIATLTGPGPALAAG